MKTNGIGGTGKSLHHEEEKDEKKFGIDPGSPRSKHEDQDDEPRGEGYVHDEYDDYNPW